MLTSDQLLVCIKNPFGSARWLVNKAKGNPKTVQDTLGDSGVQITLDLYTDEDRVAA
jgi:hypothetical protein